MISLLLGSWEPFCFALFARLVGLMVSILAGDYAYPRW